MSRGRRPDHLYIATDGKLLKIGVSEDPKRRMSELGQGVRLIKSWRRTVQMVRELEGYAKGAFSDRSIRAEWFDVPEEEFVADIARAVRIYDDDLAMRFGREPSRRCDQPFVPPYELPWLEIRQRD